MDRKLIVTREREIRLGWSLRGFPWEIELDSVKVGTVGNDETVSFDIAPGRRWPYGRQSLTGKRPARLTER